MGIELSDWVENILGKEEIAHYKQFLLFPQYFQKLSVVDASKRVSMEYLWIKELTKFEVSIRKPEINVKRAMYVVANARL